MADNGWNEYSKLVLQEIKDLGDENDRQWDKIEKNTIEIATLKVKAGIWGIIGGIIPVAMSFIVALTIWIIRKGGL